MGQKWSSIQVLSMKMKLTGLIVLSTRIPKICFFLVSGEERPKQLWKMAKGRDSIVMQNREWSV